MVAPTFFPPGYFGPILPAPPPPVPGIVNAQFTHTTRTAFKAIITKRLGDLTNVHWVDEELNLYINEALLTFGSIAQAWKNDVHLKTVVGQTYYDITTDLSTEQALLSFDLTYQDLLNLINYNLIESLSDSSPTSEITSVEEILKFARSRINLFQYLTGLVVYNSLYTFTAPLVNSLRVDDELIDLIRVAFVVPDVTYRYYRLREEDEQDIAFNRPLAFIAPKEIPDFYTSLLGTLNKIWVYPPPLNLGYLDILSVNGISATTTIDLDSIIPLPNNLVPYIKYGILADILSKEGIGNDPSRAAYCEERWREGIEIGKNYASILMFYLNGLPISIDSFDSLDAHQSGWQNRSGKPNLLASAGINLFATNRVPDNVYSLDGFSVTNAYLPANDTDFIDVKPEYIEPIADYVIHLGMIKEGSAALKDSDNLKSNFIQIAVEHNLRLVERGQTFEKLMRKVKLQESEEPLKFEEEANASTKG